MVGPMKGVVNVIRNHCDGIVAWTQTRQTNGFIFITGKLDFTKSLPPMPHNSLEIQ